MKTLNIPFEDREFRKLNNEREALGIIHNKELTWKEFILIKSGVTKK